MLQQALNDLAGTGISRYIDFIDQVDAFHEKWMNYFIPKILDQHTLTSNDYDTIPKFSYEEMNTSEMISSSLFAAGVLILYNLIFTKLCAREAVMID